MRLRRILSVMLVIGSLVSLLGLAQKGPYADEVVFESRMQEEIAIQDVAAGNTDLFLYGVSGGTIAGLSQQTLDAIEMYSAPSSGLAFIFNPYPNEAPYIAVTNTGTEIFNPFAIQAVRFAMHDLVNRQQIVDEILRGAGAASVLCVAPSDPGAYKLYLVAGKLGLTAEGNESKAIAAVTAAMDEAMKLTPRLTKVVDATSPAGFWYAFDGTVFEVQFMIRVDDPNVRLIIGNYFADQIEKTGIKVNRILRDRSYEIGVLYGTDPKDMVWSIYTEGWGGGGTNKWWEGNVNQYYSNWYAGCYPGWGDTTYWNFINPISEEVTTKLAYGQFGSMDEYWSLMTTACEEGLKDAVRVYLAQQLVYFASNKTSFETRFLYGLGDGVNNFSLYSMIPVNKDRPVRITQFSARGSLFLNAWDPIGTQGFNDLYAANLIQQCTDALAYQAPGSATETGFLAKWSDVETGVDFTTNTGLVDVPAEAIKWDSTKKEWVSTGDEVAWAKATYKITMSNFHDGSPLSLIDFAATEGFVKNWATEDFEGDPEYDSGYSTLLTPGFAYSHGGIYNWEDGSITNYYDYAFPDPNRVAFAGTPALWARASNHSQGVKWTIQEALGKIVAEGSASGTIYGFSETAGMTEIDVLVPSHVADIRAKLVEMRDAQYVPPYLVAMLPKAKLTPADIAAMYQQAIDFIDAHGHAYISQGGFYIDNYNSAINQMTLKANRDPGYPYTGADMYKMFEVGMARINEVVTPAAATAGQPVTISIKIDEATYPYNIFEPATSASLAVSLVFVSDKGETTIAATQASAGEWSVTLPGEATAGLAGGAYTIVALATPAGGLPVAYGATLLVQ
ncbi:MAG: ABC transporter substrate-binding protein [Thermotogota bacterium]